MALDEDKAALGRSAQAEPLKIGRLKQKAMDLGISTEELILMAADKVTLKGEATPGNAADNAIREDIKDLKAAVLALAQQPRPAQPQPDAMAQFQAFAGMVTAIRQLFPQQSIQDVLAQLKALDEVRGQLYGPGDDAEEEPQEQSPEAMLASVVMERLKGFNSPPPEQLKDVPPSGGPVAAPVQAAANVSGVAKMNDEEIKEWAAKVPPEARKAIKEGSLTLEAAKAQVRPYLAKLGVPGVSDEDIGRVYEEVKKQEVEK